MDVVVDGVKVLKYNEKALELARFEHDILNAIERTYIFVCII